MNYLKRRRTAVGHALEGLWAAFVAEAHLKLELAIALVVFGVGCYRGLSKTEWFMIGVCITLVLSLELFNSALEKLCNLVHPGQHPGIKYIKDVAAAAVLLACLFSLIVGAMIFFDR